MVNLSGSFYVKAILHLSVAAIKPFIDLSNKQCLAPVQSKFKPKADLGYTCCATRMGMTFGASGCRLTVSPKVPSPTIKSAPCDPFP